MMWLNPQQLTLCPAKGMIVDGTNVVAATVRLRLTVVEAVDVDVDVVIVVKQKTLPFAGSTKMLLSVVAADKVVVVPAPFNDVTLLLALLRLRLGRRPLLPAEDFTENPLMPFWLLMLLLGSPPAPPPTTASEHTPGDDRTIGTL